MFKVYCIIVTQNASKWISDYLVVGVPAKVIGENLKWK